MQTDRQFGGSIPALYDCYLGPLIFEPYATELASCLADLKNGRILETAAGTGALSRALAQTLAPGVAIVATDLNQPMLDFAAGRTDSPRIDWKQADALHLPFDDGAFDAVVCQFGAMFFPDKVAAYREALRVLKPNGHFVIAVWDRLAENEFAETVTEAVATLFPADPPRFLARIPYGYDDITLIRQHLEEAGFGRIAIDTVAQRSRAPSHRDPAIGFCLGTPLRNEIEARDAARLGEAAEAAARAVAARFGTGPIDGKIQAHVITASR